MVVNKVIDVPGNINDVERRDIHKSDPISLGSTVLLRFYHGLNHELCVYSWQRTSKDRSVF